MVEFMALGFAILSAALSIIVVAQSNEIITLQHKLTLAQDDFNYIRAMMKEDDS